MVRISAIRGSDTTSQPSSNRTSSPTPLEQKLTDALKRHFLKENFRTIASSLYRLEVFCKAVDKHGLSEIEAEVLAWEAYPLSAEKRTLAFAKIRFPNSNLPVDVSFAKKTN